MTTQALTTFVTDAVKAGKSREEIREVLGRAGWDHTEINRSLSHFAAVDFPVAVPRPKLYVSSRAVFMNLFHFIALYFSIWNVISILFSVIDKNFPDGLGYYRGFFYSHGHLYNQLLDNLAIILVALPLTLGTGYLIKRNAEKIKDSPPPRIRLHLIHLTLFVGACTVTGCGMSFVYYFLKGEIAMRFIMKLAILGALFVGSIIAYRDEMTATEKSS